MEHAFIALSLTVFFAAALQSATGIGFGVIAGPIMLLLLNSGTSIQISIVLNLLIAVLLIRSIRLEFNKAVLINLIIGSVVGLPLGLWIFLNVNIVTLKLLAGSAVLLTALLVIRNIIGNMRSTEHPPSRKGAVISGIVSGAMSGSLAMPGPVVAAWMSAAGVDKRAVRATTLSLFIFSYSAALLLQIPFGGIESATLWTCLKLAPATIAGVYVGKMMVDRLTERVFTWLILLILILTAAFLFISTL